MTEPVICDCGHLAAEHDPPMDGCRLCDCKVYSPHPDRIPGIDARTAALHEVLALARSFPWVPEHLLPEHIAALTARMHVYDQLGRRDLDEDERAALELEVERWWWEEEQDDP